MKKIEVVETMIISEWRKTRVVMTDPQLEPR